MRRGGSEAKQRTRRASTVTHEEDLEVVSLFTQVHGHIRILVQARRVISHSELGIIARK